MNAPATIRHSTSLLISETPLQFLPSLAKKLGGANEALILQQLHFLLVITEKARNNHNYFNKRWWVYNSYEQWQEEHFSWLSISTIKRLFTKLKEEGYILSKERKEGRLQLGNWYTINYEKLTKKTIRVSRNPIVHIEQGGVQDEHGTGSKLNSEGVQDEHLFYIAENTTENTYRKNGGGNSSLATDNPPPSPLPPAAVDNDSFIAINSALTAINKGLKKPFTGLPELTRILISNSKTVADVQALWRSCQSKQNPAGAFIHAIKNNLNPNTHPAAKSATSTPKPKYRRNPTTGEIEEFVGTGWGKAYGVDEEVLSA